MLCNNPFSAQAVLSDFYGEATLAHAYDFQCVGNEVELVNCKFRSTEGSSNCSAHSGPAGVICSGKRIMIQNIAISSYQCCL